MELALGAGALAMAGASAPLMRGYPAIVFSCCMVATLFVPYWAGVPVGNQFVPLALVLTALAAVALGTTTLPLLLVDRLILLLGLYAVALLGMGQSSPAHGLVLLGAWLLPYYVGRVAPVRVSGHHIGRTLALASLALSTQSVLEFAFDWHPFIDLALPASPWETWSSLQYRSTFPRSEGALGHSITMGALISMGVPFILSMRRSLSLGLRLALVSWMGLGVLATFSRSALISFVIAVSLSCIFLPTIATRAQRWLLLSATLTVVGVATPAYLAAIDGGTGVLQDSTEYRAEFVTILPDVEWVGLSSIYTEYAPDRWGWESDAYPGNVIVTLDNTILLDALEFGWIHAAILVAVLSALAVYLLRSRGNAALVSLVSQYATVATAAMITQLPYILWLVAGVGVTQYQRTRAEKGRQTADESFSSSVGFQIERVPNSRARE